MHYFRINLLLLLRGEKHFWRHPDTHFWVLFEISDEHPWPCSYGSPLTTTLHEEASLYSAIILKFLLSAQY